MGSLPSLRFVRLRRREQHPNLTGAWGFDEGTGTTVHDNSEYGNNLTVDAGLSWTAGHSGGSAIKNVGNAGSAHVAWTMSGTQITLMGWAKPLNLTAGANRPLFGIWTGTDALGSTECAIWAQRGDFGTTNVLQANVRINGNLSPSNHTALTLNTWVHLAVTFDGSFIHLFRDGVEVTTTSSAGTLMTGSFFLNIAPNPGQAEVDDVRIFNTALTAAQIIMFMNDPVAP